MRRLIFGDDARINGCFRYAKLRSAITNDSPRPRDANTVRAPYAPLLTPCNTCWVGNCNRIDTDNGSKQGP
jgi:hypothetical protein